MARIVHSRIFERSFKMIFNTLMIVIFASVLILFSGFFVGLLLFTLLGSFWIILFVQEYLRGRSK